MLLLETKLIQAEPDQLQIEEYEWTEPSAIFIDMDGFTRRDYMFADRFDNLHLLWSNNPQYLYDDDNTFDEDETTIYYGNLDQNGRVVATDVLINQQAVMPVGAGVNEEGIIHLASIADRPPCVNYLQVPSWMASDPRAWSEARCLENAGAGSSDLAIGSTGNIYIIYPDRGQEGISLVSSDDGGDTWSYTTKVVSVLGDYLVGFPRLSVDDFERLHAVWGELQPPGGSPWLRIRYAHSVDGGLNWSSPIDIAGRNQGDPNLVAMGNDVYIVWNGDAGYHGRYLKYSEDGGVTWSERQSLPLPEETGGLQGAPAIILDASRNAHILYTDSPRLYYINGSKSEWSETIQIAGPENTIARSEINNPMLAITEGNILHAMYTADAKAVYYQQLLLDLPSTAPDIVQSQNTTNPTRSVIKEDSAQTQHTGEMDTNIPEPLSDELREAPRASDTGYFGIITSIVSVSILLILVVFIRKRKQV